MEKRHYLPDYGKAAFTTFPGRERRHLSHFPVGKGGGETVTFGVKTVTFGVKKQSLFGKNSYF